MARRKNRDPHGEHFEVHVRGFVSAGTRYLVQLSAALRVSTDCLLGVTDVMDPVPKDDGVVKDFDDRYSYIFRDEDFLTCVEVCNALSDEDRKCMTGIVKQYGMNRIVLNADEKPSASEKTGDGK